MLAHAALREVGPHVAKTHDVSSDGSGLPMQVTQSPPKGLIMRRSLRNPRPSLAARPIDRVGLVAALALSGIFATQGFALDPGATITAGPQTPADAKAALSSSKTVVIAFVVPGAADDDEVAASIARLRGNASASRNVRFLVYKVTSKKPTFGDLPKVLQILGTPTVAVITPDDRLQNMWTGLVDDVLIGQSISTARESAGRGADSSPTKPAKSKKLTKKEAAANAKGQALAKKVDAAYSKVPAVGFTVTGTLEGSPIQVSGVSVYRKGKQVGGTGQFVLKGKTIDLINQGKKTYSRLVGASCWALTSISTMSNEGLLAGTNSTFTAPTRIRDTFLMRESHIEKGVRETQDVVIDAHTYRILSARIVEGQAFDPGATATFSTITNVPTIPTPKPLC
jgi:hypothetical protein